MTAATSQSSTTQFHNISRSNNQHQHTIHASCTAIHTHTNSNLVKHSELLWCVGFAITTKIINTQVWPTFERPIPYQVTSDGDVILDFALNEVDNGLPVGTVMNYCVCLLVPIFVFLLFSLCHCNSSTTAFIFSSEGDFHCACCVLAVALGLDSMLCDTTKRYVGRLRPIFYDMCGFDINSLSCTEENYSEARRSFPSGHTHVAFTCATVLSLYLLGKASRLSQAKEGIDSSLSYNETGWTNRIVMSLSLSPLLYAIFIAAMVVKQNFHFPSDAIGGAILGSTCAIASYHMWFHPCFSRLASIPLRGTSHIRHSFTSNRGTEAHYIAFEDDNEKSQLDENEYY